MKYHIGFFAALVVSLGVIAYWALTFNEHDLFLFHEAHEDVGQVLENFWQSHTPVAEINFSSLYGGDKKFQVLHPLLNLRRFRVDATARTCSGIESEFERAECSINIFHLEGPVGANEDFSAEYLAKGEAFHHFLRDDAKLPERFVESPPLIDGSGFSYAYLLSERGIKPYSQRTWIEDHLAYFKVSELKDVLVKHHIENPEFLMISQLSDGEIEEVIKGNPFVVTKSYLLVRNQSRLGFSPLSYWFYDISDLFAELKQGKYELIPYVPDALCLQRVGNYCWTYNSKHALSYLYRYSLALVIGLGFIFALFLGFYFKYLFEKAREQKKHRLSLQVLSHEFRTPVSSMMLVLDQFRENQERLSVTDQDLIMRLSSEIFRLQRIIEVSKTYLQAESRLIPFKYSEISSLNSWIVDFIAESGFAIECRPLVEDRSLRADPFWLKFVLSTFVQNAFAHGKAPVCIRLESAGEKIKISVEDRGECEFASLHQMSDAFVKSRRSEGMGLGLNIAKFIVEEWGSEIYFSPKPTSFTLSLVDQPVEI